MAKLTRKSLIVDDEKVKELAQRWNTSESAAVREAVKHALAAAQVTAAIRELHESGGIDDVFGRLPDEMHQDVGGKLARAARLDVTVAPFEAE